MRKVFPVIACLLLYSLVAQGRPDEPSDLKTRADAAQGADRAKLSLEYARQQLELANKLYEAGDVAKAEVAIGEVRTYSQQATEAATTANKKLKRTEIDLRKLEHRMRDIGQSLSIDDRPPVEKTVQQLEELRAQLLAKMFGPKAEPKDNKQ
jgi:outer membrane protein TolC